ncbi:L-rhamnose mutarotase [Dyella subtropica]|uniref:L-rhamnose mutarotase n=1 Tax=Dyella subtropica TaxID=2992127 RepID=UPI0022507702|nr:L-rhamnose mutarotase [Dyella subtropica]
MPRLYFALDLKDDPVSIAEYERWHQPEHIWPEIVASIHTAGVTGMDIFRTGNRLVLMMDVPDDFDGAAKQAADAANPRVQAWEALMNTFQQPLPWAKPGQKWMPMSRIFSLAECKPR